jgi:virulence-associated protein VagC
MTTRTVRVFRNGRSEAIRIPAAWAFDCKTVEVIQTPDGLLVRRPARTLADLAARYDALPPLRIKRPQADHPRKISL